MLWREGSVSMPPVNQMQQSPRTSKAAGLKLAVQRQSNGAVP
jgi:hypothetical protein